eukprot:3387218-Rhodomonas_salina.1
MCIRDRGGSDTSIRGNHFTGVVEMRFRVRYGVYTRAHILISHARMRNGWGQMEEDQLGIIVHDSNTGQFIGTMMEYNEGIKRSDDDR